MRRVAPSIMKTYGISKLIPKASLIEGDDRRMPNIDKALQRLGDALTPLCQL